jgi:hypothetical protein
MSIQKKSLLRAPKATKAVKVPGAPTTEVAHGEKQASMRGVAQRTLKSAKSFASAKKFTSAKRFASAKRFTSAKKAH